MISLYDDLVQGLNEAIEFEKGRRKAKVTKLTIEHVKKIRRKRCQKCAHNGRAISCKVQIFTLGK